MSSGKRNEGLLSSMRKSPRLVECCAVLGPKPQGETALPPTNATTSFEPHERIPRRSHGRPIGDLSIEPIGIVFSQLVEVTV